MLSYSMLMPLIDYAIDAIDIDADYAITPLLIDIAIIFIELLLLPLHYRHYADAILIIH
jgi:hypothetical protein